LHILNWIKALPSLFRPTAYYDVDDVVCISIWFANNEMEPDDLVRSHDFPSARLETLFLTIISHLLHLYFFCVCWGASGEKLIQLASDSLVTEILIQPQLSTLKQCMRNLLASFTRHRHVIHAGYTLSGPGSWILQV
jgi:hypothetical protein